MNQSTPSGLTSTEVAERVAQGLVNRVVRSDAAEYLDILQRNVFTVFNGLVVPAAVVLLLLQDYRAGFAVSGMAVVNTLLGLVQEIRAKRQLDRLTLLAESTVRVVRDGTTSEIAAGDVVQGDLLLLTAGDSVVADGAVVESRYLEIDEALLTGESDPVPRKPGEQLLSGSFCVAGEGSYLAERVGAMAFAQKTATEARSYQYTASPLQAQIDRLIRILSAVAVALCAGYVGLYFLHPGALPVDELFRMIAATITSMVPQGLVLMATIALLLGALSMTAKGAVVNRLAAVEAMAGIDTLCMDKTGTLTTNQLRLMRVQPLVEKPGEEEIRQLVALFASCSLDKGSKSLQAMRQELGEVKGELLDQLPFKSQNRYSAVRVRPSDLSFRGFAPSEESKSHAPLTLILGAFEALQPFLDNPDTTHAAWQQLATTGWRLLLFAEAATPPRDTFDGTLDGFRLHPLAFVALGDDLRPEAPAVLNELASQGIRFKILSGDNPETVRATVAPLGQPAFTEGPVISGAELAAVTEPDEVINSRSVFGRVSPWQKVEIVRSLTAQGHQVAMIGDGVNDVLPIKNAALGIAMGDGSRATKTVAGIVLQNNDFGLLPKLLDEGRIIVRNLRRSGKLFLNKNVYFLLLIIATIGIFQLPFPLAPQQVTLLNFLTIGVPALLITLDRRKAEASRGDYVREVGGFALRTGLVTGVTALAMMLLSAHGWEDETDHQRTMVLTTLVLLGWVTLLLALGRDGGDRLLSALPIAGLAVYLLAMYVPIVATFFELEPLTPLRWAWVVAATVAAAGAMWAIERAT